VRLQEGIRELARVEPLLGKFRYGFFDLYGIHLIAERIPADTWVLQTSDHN